MCEWQLAITKAQNCTDEAFSLYFKAMFSLARSCAFPTLFQPALFDANGQFVKFGLCLHRKWLSPVCPPHKAPKGRLPSSAVGKKTLWPVVPNGQVPLHCHPALPVIIVCLPIRMHLPVKGANTILLWPFGRAMTNWPPPACFQLEMLLILLTH